MQDDSHKLHKFIQFHKLLFLTLYGILELNLVSYPESWSNIKQIKYGKQSNFYWSCSTLLLWKNQELFEVLSANMNVANNSLMKILSKSLFLLFYLYPSFQFTIFFIFDLELDKIVYGTKNLKKVKITRDFIGWHDEATEKVWMSVHQNKVSY